MKLLLDQGLPRSATTCLANFGIAAQHVADFGMAAAADDVILDFARVQQTVVVTLDADFHRLLSASNAVAPSVVRIRIEGLKGDQLAELLVQVLVAARTELEAGAVVSVTENHIRVRTLPIVQ